MFIISQEKKIWVKHCPSRVLTSCTILIATLAVSVIRIGTGKLVVLNWLLVLDSKVGLVQKVKWKRFLVHFLRFFIVFV